jgi:hypothetical protein
MAFRIHTESAELQRELENKLAALDGQLDKTLDYEITVEVLPREQALERAECVAEQIGAESIFVAAGTVAPEPAQYDIPQAIQTAPEVFSTASTQDSRIENIQSVSEPDPIQAERGHRVDTEKLKQAVALRAAQARELSQRAGAHLTAMLKRAGAWTAQKTGEAQAAAADARVRLGAKSERWKSSAAEWNAQRLERKEAEMKSRQERQRVAHREAELAAISAHIMLERQRNDEKARLAAEAQKKPQVKPVIRPVAKKPADNHRDMWPVWRNAFAAAACIALIGVFLLATGNKQTNASPSETQATSTELSKPAVVVPSHVVHLKPAAAAPHAVAQSPKPIAQSSKPPKPSARKRVANDGDDGFQEVTVRNYQIAPPRKDAKGVTQISDME